MLTPRETNQPAYRRAEGFRVGIRKLAETINGFTLTELLVVIAVIRNPRLPQRFRFWQVERRSEAGVCLSNSDKSIWACGCRLTIQRFIALGWRQYTNRNLLFCYKDLLSGYVGPSSSATSRSRLSPALRTSFYYDLRSRSAKDMLQAGPWIPSKLFQLLLKTGRISLSTCPFQSRHRRAEAKLHKASGETIAVGEAPALFPYSWHGRNSHSRGK